MSTTPGLSQPQLQRLLAVARSLVSELDLESVLGHLLQAARELTEATYAAIGIIDQEGEGLERFVFLGLDESARRTIGQLPHGRGVLGELIRNPEPLRLEDVSAHPRSYGFPAGHPPMTTFLGVPVMVRGEAYGNLYLTDKAEGAQFDDTDEALVVVLAEWAAVAIDNARLYEGAEDRRRELERAVRGLEATASLSRELGGETDLGWVLALIVRRGRALVEARSLLVVLAAAGRLVVAEAAGELRGDIRGLSLPADGSVLGSVFASGETARFGGDGADPSIELGVPSTAALVTPLTFRGGSEGLLVALDPMGRGSFNADDELLMRSFATSAATAIATAQSVEKEKLSLSIEASEAERGRWARELHDQTLQQLGALRVMHESALARGDPEAAQKLMERAVGQLDQAIGSLEGLITELRPASLDDLGVGAALENLVERLRGTVEFEIEMGVDLAYEAGSDPHRLTPDVEATIYRVVQEALNNVAKHADARSVGVSVVEDAESVSVIVSDDGRGFSSEGHSGRFGLVGMKERVALAGGKFELDSAPGTGTTVKATLPALRVNGGAPS